MHLPSMVDAGIKNLIAQMQLVVPDCNTSSISGGSTGGGGTHVVGDVLDVGGAAWGDELFSYIAHEINFFDHSRMLCRIP
jgi:hypothetical protein